MSLVIVQDILHDTKCSYYKHNIKKGTYAETDGIFVNSFTDALKYEPIATCKCVQKGYHTVYLQNEKKKKLERYKNLLKKYAEMSGLQVSENSFDDIIIKSKIETWIVSVISITDNENVAEICLYHKNNIEFSHLHNKCGTSLYPDYHIQYQKKQSIGDLVLYIVQHEQYRWQVKDTLSEKVMKLLKSLS